MRSPAALSWARRHASLDDEAGCAAIHLLAEIADRSDAQQLRALLEASQASEDGFIYSQCSLVDGLARLRDEGSVMATGELYAHTVYAYLRRRCTRALSELTVDFGTKVAPQALYDCEPETRSIAHS